MSLHTTGQHPIVRAATEQPAPAPAPAPAPPTLEAFAIEAARAMVLQMAAEDKAGRPRRVSSLVAVVVVVIALGVSYVGVQTFREKSARLAAFEADAAARKQADDDRHDEEITKELKRLASAVDSIFEILRSIAPDAVSTASKSHRDRQQTR